MDWIEEFDVTEEYLEAKDAVTKVLGRDHPPKDMFAKEKPNIIFLDVDGVLNCMATKHMISGFTGLDDEKIGVLKQMRDMMDAKIVLVSDWKHSWSTWNKENQDAWAMILDYHLLQQGLVISDKTYDISVDQRGRGIVDWINKTLNGVNKILILDDNTFEYKKYGLRKYQIQTAYHKPNGGISEKHLRQLERILPNLGYKDIREKENEKNCPEWDEEH